MEGFVAAASDEDWERAATFLDLSSAEGADPAELARQLSFVLSRKLWVDAGAVPATPDAVSDSEAPSERDARRSLSLGTLSADGRSIDVRLWRVKAPDAEPVWLFYPWTVAGIEALYDEYGPGPVARRLPRWSTAPFGGLPVWKWIGLIVALVGGVLSAWATWRTVGRAAGKREGRDAQVLTELRRPAAALAGVTVGYLLAAQLALTGVVGRVVDPLLLGGIILCVAWIGSTAIRFASDHVIEAYVRERGEEDDLATKRALTRLSIGRRSLVLFVAVTAGALVVSQLRLLETLGLSFAISAGVLTAVLGFAAQNVLGNIISGVQVAIAQPIRIGDVVEFEGHWGHVEEITYTFVTIRTWDHRRVVVPLKYLLERPIENWSRRDARLVKPIYVHVDHRVDVAGVRSDFDEACRAHELWDGERDPEVIVHDLKDDAVVLRAVASAADPGRAWTLHCDLRERLLEIVRAREGALARRRVELVGDGAAPG